MKNSRISEDMRSQMKDLAIRMLEKSYTPYSHFKVGAALLTREGKLYGGCNIENAAFTPGNCAERTAIFKAVSEGQRKFDAILVVGGHEGEISDFCPPCGVCRQVMMEFCDPETFEIILVNGEGEYLTHTLKEYLPDGFGPGNL